jgi:hypothetical protein
MNTRRIATAVLVATAIATAVACDPNDLAVAGEAISEQCHFQGDDVACVQHRKDAPDTQTLDHPAYDTTPGDPGPDYGPMAEHWEDTHIGAWPPAPEPGREQYLTPYEDRLPNDYRPFSPIRHCADGSMWDPAKIHRCPNGNPGTITWVHHDGTVVTIGPDSPRGIRWNGGEIR